MSFQSTVRPSQLQNNRKLIGFMVGDVQYGIDIMRIREIVNPIELVEMPSSPPYVVGIADHRRVVVPIIDIRLRFGLDTKPDNRRTKWLLVNFDDKTVGMRVEQVTDVIRVSDNELRDAHPLIDSDNQAWVSNIYGTAKGLVFEVQLESVLRPGELQMPELPEPRRDEHDDRV